MALPHDQVRRHSDSGGGIVDLNGPLDRVVVDGERIQAKLRHRNRSNGIGRNRRRALRRQAENGGHSQGHINTKPNAISTTDTAIAS